MGQRSGHREPDGLAAQPPAVQPGPGGMVPPPAAGQLVHDLQPAPADGSAGVAEAVGGAPCRQPRQQSKTLQTSSRPVPRPRRYSQSSASGQPTEAKRPQTALGRREGRWRGGALRALGMTEPRGACGAGPADAIGSPSTSAANGREPIPPSAGPGHRLRVQGVGREFAGHQDAILEKVGLEADLRDRVPEHLPRDCRARGIGWKRPRVARARVNASPTADALHATHLVPPAYSLSVARRQEGVPSAAIPLNHDTWIPTLKSVKHRLRLSLTRFAILIALFYFPPVPYRRTILDI